ncbi:VOC family protein [Streptomyces sp. NPDC001165]|uniref:VOC family protein n=1 Tax=Streptomyces sp. NPDC001165 TaxID=3364546 RepID=UPI0036BB1B08
MDITIHPVALPHDDPDASLAFTGDVLGFEVRSDTGRSRTRWIAVGPPGRPNTYGWILLAAPDVDATFEKVQAGDAEVVQEPTRASRRSSGMGCPTTPGRPTRSASARWSRRP